MTQIAANLSPVDPPATSKRPPVMRGAANFRWNGGRAWSGGYPAVRAPEGHPRTNARGYIREHILVVERALGHYLPTTARVHHVDEDKTNNAPPNLVVCQNDAYHFLLHQRQRALDACGDANAVPCKYCHGYDRQDDMRRRMQNGRRQSYHGSCDREYQRNRRARLQREEASR